MAYRIFRFPTLSACFGHILNRNRKPKLMSNFSLGPLKILIIIIKWEFCHWQLPAVQSPKHDSMKRRNYVDFVQSVYIRIITNYQFQLMCPTASAKCEWNEQWWMMINLNWSLAPWPCPWFPGPVFVAVPMPRHASNNIFPWKPAKPIREPGPPKKFRQTGNLENRFESTNWRNKKKNKNCFTWGATGTKPGVSVEISSSVSLSIIAWNCLIVTICVMIVWSYSLDVSTRSSWKCFISFRNGFGR